MADHVNRDKHKSAGEMLAKAREQEQRSVKEIAHELHLDEWIIQALESDDFGRIGAPVFVKGHLRKYAELMEVPIDDLIAAYYRSENAPSTPPLVATSAEPRRLPRISSAMVIGLVTFSVIVLIAAWWFRRNEPTVPEVSQTEQAAEQAEVTLDTPSQSTTETSSRNSSNTPEPASPTVETPQERVVANDRPSPRATQSSPRDSNPIPEGQVRFSMVFEQDSWVEIRDARGRRLYFGMAISGATPSVQGAPPLDVLLGNARGVELQVNGQGFAIPSGSRRGRTARFQVE